MVPVVSAEDGSWLLPEPLRPLMKPGGHGAIWKLMLDEGVFTWLRNRRREAAIVRQIRLGRLLMPSHWLSDLSSCPCGDPGCAQ